MGGYQMVDMMSLVTGDKKDKDWVTSMSTPLH